MKTYYPLALGYLLLIKTLVATALLLFISAGTLSYFNGWMLLALIFVPFFIFITACGILNPEFLARRLVYREKRKTQVLIVAMGFCIYTTGCIMAGISYRFNIALIGGTSLFVAFLLYAIAIILYIIVYTHNPFIFRTICTCADQRVVTSGIYSLIRHPMYLAGIFLYMSFAFTLNSYITLGTFFLLVPILIARILDEEKELSKNLKGYREYTCTVKYRIIPFLW